MIFPAGTDLSAGLPWRESRRGRQCRESSVSPRTSSVWTKYQSPLLLKYFPQTCQCLESVKLGVRRRRDLRSQDHPPARWWRWVWLGSNVVMMDNKRALRTSHRGLDNSLGWSFFSRNFLFWIFVETFQTTFITLSFCCFSIIVGIYFNKFCS